MKNFKDIQFKTGTRYSVPINESNRGNLLELIGSSESNLNNINRLVYVFKHYVSYLEFEIEILLYKDDSIVDTYNLISYLDTLLPFGYLKNIKYEQELNKNGGYLLGHLNKIPFYVGDTFTFGKSYFVLKEYTDIIPIVDIKTNNDIGKITTLYKELELLFNIVIEKPTI